MDEEIQALLEQIRQLEARVALYETWEIVDCEELWCIPDASGTMDCTGALCIRTALPEPSSAFCVSASMIVLFGLARIRGHRRSLFSGTRRAAGADS